MFDGKIGLWPFTVKYVAHRSSAYRQRGTLCTRNTDTVDPGTYKSFLIDKVIPAIMLKWPQSERPRCIFIQQDNATPHIAPTDPDLVAAGTADGWNIRLICQPPNSPDLNALDLGFFSSSSTANLRMELTT